MKKDIKIGFDFDKVFVDYPPLIPDSLIDYIYKKHNHNLIYRIPGTIEQKIRLFFHLPAFRQPISNNIKILKDFSSEKSAALYLISGRLGFLKKRTDEWIKRNDIKKYFKDVYFNFDNHQAHLFKNSIIKKLAITHFIDDDLDLIKFVAKQNPKVNFYWMRKAHKVHKNSKRYKEELAKNVTPVTNLKDVYSSIFKQ